MKENTKIFLLSGQARVGKDTVADELVLQLKEKGFEVFRQGLAWAVKKEVAAATAYSIPEMEREKEKWRPLWQTWGTEFRRNLCGKNYWLQKWADDFEMWKESEAVGAVAGVVSDVRFDNEVRWMKVWGKILGYKVFHIAIKRTWRWMFWAKRRKLSRHSSEDGVKEEIDYTIRVRRVEEIPAKVEKAVAALVGPR